MIKNFQVFIAFNISIHKYSNLILFMHNQLFTNPDINTPTKWNAFPERLPQTVGLSWFKFQEVQLENKCDGKNEKPKDVIRVKNGGHIKNLIVGVNAGNGIVCEGSCILENVDWKEVCKVFIQLFLTL